MNAHVHAVIHASEIVSLSHTSTPSSADGEAAGQSSLADGGEAADQPPSTTATISEQPPSTTAEEEGWVTRQIEEQGVSDEALLESLERHIQRQQTYQIMDNVEAVAMRQNVEDLASERAEVQEETDRFVESLHANLDRPVQVNQAALEAMENAAQAAAMDAEKAQPLAGAAFKSRTSDEPSIGPRPIDELRKLAGSDGVQKLLKAGDVLSFATAEVRVAEVNAVQRRWSVTKLTGKVRSRSLEHKCPFFAQPGGEPSRKEGLESDEDHSDGESVGEPQHPNIEVCMEAANEGHSDAPPPEGTAPPAEGAPAGAPAEGAHSKLVKRAASGSRICRTSCEYTSCPFWVRINMLAGARSLRRTEHYDLTLEGDELRMLPKKEADEMSDVSTSALTDVSAIGRSIRKKSKSDTLEYADPAVVEVANLRHTCNPYVLEQQGKNYVLQDGTKTPKRMTPYQKEDLKPVIMRIILNRELELGSAQLGKQHLEACYQELSKYVEGPAQDVRVLAGKIGHLCLKEVQVKQDMSPLFAQAYAAALRNLGHAAEVHIRTAQEAWQQEKRVAVARHAGQQRKLKTMKPFDDVAYQKQNPLPTRKDAPKVEVGFKGTPRYMLLVPPGRWQKIWYMDVGGARGKSPYNLFHIGTLDGNHHCHGIEDNMMVDSESCPSWCPFIASAVKAFPALNTKGARAVKDAHKGSHAACLKAAPRAVPFTDYVHLRRHMRTDYSWGADDSRSKLVTFYDKNVRQPDYKNVLVAINEASQDRSLSKGMSRLKQTPMEEIFPAMRHQPTGHNHNTAEIGCLFNEVTSNAAECTMKMFLAIRAEPDISRAQVMMWQLRQLRWKKCVWKMRKAQQEDARRDPQWRGLTPFVRGKCEVRCCSYVHLPSLQLPVN